MESIEEITLELTNRCNLKCKICNIWKEKIKKDLTLKDIKKITELIDNPFSISITGGEPFLNEEINKIYHYLFKLYLKKRIKNIDISTNAYSSKVIDFLNVNKNYLLPLSISISLDGLSRLHNLQRGRNNAFKKTINNIMKIKEFKMPISIKFVITSLNYKDILKVYYLSKKIGCSFIIKFFERVNHYYHRDNNFDDNLMLVKKQKTIVKKMIRKIYNLERNKTKNKLTKFGLRCLTKALENRNLGFINRCFTPDKSLFISCDGKIYSCIYYPSIGKINESEIDWGKNKKIVKNALMGKCPRCLSYHGFLKEFNYSNF